MLKQKRSAFIFVILFALVMLLTACAEIKDYKALTSILNDHEVALKIIRTDWGYDFSDGDLHKKDALEYRGIEIGDEISVESWGGSAVITIEDIKSDTVKVRFQTDLGVSSSVHGRVDNMTYLEEERHADFTVEIQYGEEYKMVTVTSDAGVIWKLRFYSKQTARE